MNVERWSIAAAAVFAMLTGGLAAENDDDAQVNEAVDLVDEVTIDWC